MPKQAVDIGLVEGSQMSGRVTRFDPTASELRLETGLLVAPRRMAIPTERIAFIAFGGERKHHGSAPMTIHVAGGKTIEAHINPEHVQNRVGFFGTPVDRASKYGEVYFFAHGVLAKAKPTPLGEILLGSGVIKKSQLDEGVSLQSVERTMPLGEILVESSGVQPQHVIEATELQKRKKMRIGEILVEEGFATEQQIAHALAAQKKKRGKRLGQVLIEMGAITDVDLSLALANKFSLEFADLDELELDPRAMRAVPRRIISEYKVLPVRFDGEALVVAICDPLYITAVEALRMLQPRRIVELLVTRTQLERYVKGFLQGIDSRKQGQGFDALLEQVEEQSGKDEVDDHEVVVDASDSAVIRLVNQVIIDGYRSGASDIHIEPNGKTQSLRIRFRIDGVCSTYKEVPPALRAPLVARLKIMARLDIAERRKPQDGKIRFRVQDKEIELRVASIPTVANNEDVVMRVLTSAKPLPLDQMKLSAENLAGFKAAIAKPYGLVLCVGPTGSGKTTTLHSALGERNKEGTKIWTAEDPVEITQRGIRQVQVHPRIGFTFANALRSFLRADPDVIMVGEMRDLETASIGVEASLTGHMVMSTLHTNSAPQTISRLIDMGIDRFSFSDALLAVLAQRLVRALCVQCAEPETPTVSEFEDISTRYGKKLFAKEVGAKDDIQLFRPRGCARCKNTGYKGRVAIHELLVMNDTLTESVQQGATTSALREIAVEQGMRTLLQDGIRKCVQGLTDMKQVLAVCSR